MHHLITAIRKFNCPPLVWGIFLVAATLGYFAASRLLQDYLYADVVRPVSLFASFGADFWKPEPLEMPIYVLGYVIIPFLAWLGCRAYQRGWLRRLAIPLLLLAVFAMVAAGLALLAWLPRGIAVAVAYAGEHGVTKGVWLLLTKRLFAMRLLFALVGAYFVAQLFTRRLHSVPLQRLDQWRGWRWAQSLLLVAVVVFLFHPNFPVEPHHYAYFIGPANDMLHGKALLYETSHLYGLLNEYALAGLFALGLPLTYASLSALLFVAFAGFSLGWYFLLYRWLGSRTLAAVGLLAAIAWLFLFQTSPTRSVYHFPAMTPWRFWLLIPVAWMLLQQAQTQMRWRKWAIVVASSLAIFWNLENGIFTAVAAWLCLTYAMVSRQLATTGLIKVTIKAGGRLAAEFLGTTLAIGGLISTINFAWVGRWPDWNAYLREVLPFGHGIGMTPLPLVGLFELFVIAYAAAFCWAAHRMVCREHVDIGALFFSLFGAASLLYYIGESTWQNLYLVTAPIIALLVWVIRQVLSRPPADYTMARVATAGINAIVVLVAGMLILKIPVELATRDYTTVKSSFNRAVIADASLSSDVAELRRDFGHLPRLAVVHRQDVPILVNLGKPNALNLYYLFNLYYTEQVEALIAQLQLERPPIVIIGKVSSISTAGRDLDDQIRYLRDHLPAGYQRIRELQTLDIYELK